MNILSIHNVRYAIREGFWLKKKYILNDVTLDIAKGESVGLVGQNGAGKTTFLKIASGIIRPVHGESTSFGVASSSIKAKRRIGFLAENQYVYASLTAKEWLLFMGECSGVRGEFLISKVSLLLQEFDLVDYSDKLMKDLSKGQKQRVLIAQLFLNDPDLLLLDEPMSGLDHVWREHMRVRLNKFTNSGGTVVLSSHILSDIEAMCSRIVYIKKGEVKWDGSADEVFGMSSMMQVVLKKEEPMPWRDWGEVLWERGLQRAVLLSSESFEGIQREIGGDASVTILRANPYIPSLEAMFKK